MKRALDAIREFLALESASGILLMMAAVAALALANSPLAHLYDAFTEIPVELCAGSFAIAKPLLLWINDGLMAVFFFLIGLEIKREMLEGELSSPAQILLPAIAAAAGMALPAAIYATLNWSAPFALRGWAIPAATDIAFALGVLALLGERVPNALKVFLLTLAIFDDIGAIVIIALFYIDHLSVVSLAVAAATLAVLPVLNRRGVLAVTPYLLTGLVLWLAVLKSGVHATVAGVALALFIPLRTAEAESEPPPLKRLEHDLHPAVAYVILPLFAFANAGVSFAGMTPAWFAEAVPLGIAAGLFAGKLAGVFVASWLAVKVRIAKLPDGVTWFEMLGTAALCGIGFTMSLFIASLAFEGGDPNLAIASRLGILAGSSLSGIVGYAILAVSLRRR